MTKVWGRGPLCPSLGTPLIYSSEGYVMLAVVVAIGEFAGRLSDYEISIPVRVNAVGQFISHSVEHSVDNTPPPPPSSSSLLSSFWQPRRRRRRSRRSSSSSSDTVDYRVPVAGTSLHVSLQPSAHLLGPGVVVERRQGGRANLTASTRINTGVGSRLCHFAGHVRGRPRSTVAISTCTGLVRRHFSSIYLKITVITHCPLSDPTCAS